MDVTKSYKYIGFGAMDVTKHYKFIGFGAMDVTKPSKFTRFGAGQPAGSPKRTAKNNRNSGTLPRPESAAAKLMVRRLRGGGRGGETVLIVRSGL